MAPEIPQELIGAFLECLDPWDLRCCALVSRSWTPLAQSLIFHTVSLGVGLQQGSASGLVDMPGLMESMDDLNDFESFWKLLGSSPHLTHYIRTLNLGLRPLPSELRSNFTPLSSDAWDKIEDCIVALLPMLQNLESLGLFPCGPYTHTFRLEPHISRAFRCLSLQSLSFSAWCFTDSLTSTSFGETPPTSLRFIDCDFQAPMVGFAEDLDVLELHHCDGLENFSQRRAHCMSISISRRTPAVSQTLCRPLLIDRSFSFIFDAGALYPSSVRIGAYRGYAVDPKSPPSFSLPPFDRLEHLYLSFFYGLTPTAWLETVFRSIILKPGTTMHISFTRKCPPLNCPEWDGNLDAMLNCNPTLLLKSREVHYNAWDIGIVKYAFISQPLPRSTAAAVPPVPHLSPGPMSREERLRSLAHLPYSKS